MFKLEAHGKTLELDAPVVMGILNVTPDSFSDGGEFAAYESACRHADEMVAQGAGIIDIGGESTRPGAADVALEEELKRVIPLVEYVARYHDVWISVDTSKAELMRQAVKAGAHIINDVRALQEPGALEAAATSDVPVCLMHMQGQPRTMQQAPQYEDVVSDVKAFFRERIQACQAAGIPRERIMLDVGFGFGKTLEHNYQLLANLDEFHEFQLPLLIGLSRKSMIGGLLGREPKDRLAGSLAGALQSLQLGAHIVRVHDVEQTVDTVKIFNICRQLRR
ncbi:dihydropteroate synthase [Shewanella corallii]|uniref:Dihydropteroate synthase n=1 Tax=Shewanella corallii TaxID=560080 RepID=A0ABT0N7C4_9GAMM|nr:dihydropteroate synthase [Shewanella corallii]MCL2913732.1 dihydropteroate synthase [Shewanella corallii]